VLYKCFCTKISFCTRPSPAAASLWSATQIALDVVHFLLRTGNVERRRPSPAAVEKRRECVSRSQASLKIVAFCTQILQQNEQQTTEASRVAREGRAQS